MNGNSRLQIVFMPGWRRPGTSYERSQEIKRRMRTRFAWIAVLALVSLGFVMACSTKYSSSSNGLVVVPTQGSSVMETFSLDLSNGHAAQINNVNGPPITGLSKSVILDPAGTFVYVLVTQNPTQPAGPTNITGIATFKVASDGKLGSISGQTLNGDRKSTRLN